MSNLLTKEAILNKQDVSHKDIVVKEWNGTVRLKEMSGLERDIFETEVMARKKGNKVDLKGLRCFLVALCAVNEKGERLFLEEDIKALEKKNAGALNNLFIECQKLNKLKAEDLDAQVKN